MIVSKPGYNVVICSATGNTLLCDEIFEHAKYIIMYVGQMKHFFMIF